MFIEIKKIIETDESGKEEYINIFKISKITTCWIEDEEITEIQYDGGSGSYTTYSHEPLKDFMKRLKKETKEMGENIENRFEIMDL